jgi:hypothetical protein
MSLQVRLMQGPTRVHKLFNCSQLFSLVRLSHVSIQNPEIISGKSSNQIQLSKRLKHKNYNKINKVMEQIKYILQCNARHVRYSCKIVHLVLSNDHTLKVNTKIYFSTVLIKNVDYTI